MTALAFLNGFIVGCLAMLAMGLLAFLHEEQD